MKIMVETSARHLHVTDADLKALFGENAAVYVGSVEPGRETPQSAAAIGIWFPAAGDTLWDTAKKLGRPPEEVRRENPDLAFPLSGEERIVVYRRRELRR